MISVLCDINCLFITLWQTNRPPPTQEKKGGEGINKLTYVVRKIGTSIVSLKSAVFDSRVWLNVYYELYGML